jgi:hypothetical protein
LNGGPVKADGHEARVSVTAAVEATGKSVKGQEKMSHLIFI